MILHLLLLAQLANADTTTQPCDHALTIYGDIAAKSQRSSMNTTGETCTINWTPKPGQTVTFEDKQSKIAAHKVRSISLLQKFRAGTATPAEKDELLERLAALVLKQE